MTLSVDDKRTLRDVRFAKAREAQADAQANLAGERLNTAVNRSYYAALNDSRRGESDRGAVTTPGLASSERSPTYAIDEPKIRIRIEIP